MLIMYGRACQTMPEPVQQERLFCTKLPEKLNR